MLQAVNVLDLLERRSSAACESALKLVRGLCRLDPAAADEFDYRFCLVPGHGPRLPATHGYTWNASGASQKGTRPARWWQAAWF
jgi:hypothetical protein